MPFKDPAARKAYDRQKYLKNRAGILRRVKARYKLKRTEIAAYYKHWKAKNRESNNAYIAQWKRNMPTATRRRYNKTNRMWRRQNTEKVLAKNRRYEKKNNLQRFAHLSVRAAILCGILVRPKKCSDCGKRCHPHAHHPDYSKPLDVLWLCHACHVEAHGGSFRNSQIMP